MAIYTQKSKKKTYHLRPPHERQNPRNKCRIINTPKRTEKTKLTSKKKKKRNRLTLDSKQHDAWFSNWRFPTRPKRCHETHRSRTLSLTPLRQSQPTQTTVSTFLLPLKSKTYIVLELPDEERKVSDIQCTLVLSFFFFSDTRNIQEPQRSSSFIPNQSRTLA